MPPRSRTLLMLGILPLVGGCDLLGPKECTADIRPAIEVEIRSAETGSYLASEATAWATDGTFRDSLRLSRGASVSGRMLWMARSGADERPGTYRVEVSAPGYVTWVREGIRVRDGDCHVSTVALDARLQPVAN